MIIKRIQEALQRNELAGWLFFDHHRRDPLAYRILGLPENLQPSRRWYYFVPASGEPSKLVHMIESAALDGLPGQKATYSSWIDQQAKLAVLLRGAKQVAMQYSPLCAIPYVSLVDAGTLELIRNNGTEVVSSANLVQEFEARWSEEQLQQHISAGKLVDRVRREAFEYISARLRAEKHVSEYEVQQFVLSGFKQAGLVTDHGPIVAANANASDPHYEPSRQRSSSIHTGDLVLIDLWAKLDEPNAVYYDVTWTGFCGSIVPENIKNVFSVVTSARRKASEFVIRQVADNQQIAGYQVDDQARTVISENGFGEFFFHRTGHSIGTEVHGTGANMDNFESHDERRIIPQTCFSIEPGIYLPEFGIRSEVNVYVGASYATVTGEQQEELILV